MATDKGSHIFFSVVFVCSIIYYYNEYIRSMKGDKI